MMGGDDEAAQMRTCTQPGMCLESSQHSAVLINA